MPPKPIDFDTYLKWFDTNKVVIKGQSSTRVEFKTTKAAGKALLQKAQNTAAGGTPKAQPVAHQEPAEDFEWVFEYFVDDRGDVMIKCAGYVIGPAVSLDWEKEVEEDVFDEEWEKVVGEKEEEWDLV